MKKLKIAKFAKEKFKVYLTATLLAVALIAGGTYAWNAVWHGTDWIQAGKIVESENIAENFEYLYSRAGVLPEGGCSSTGQILIWDGSKFYCGDQASGGSGGSACNDTATILAGGSSHTVGDCLSAGGAAVDIGGGDCLCKFETSPSQGDGYNGSCPTGWSQHLSWSQTTGNNCSDTGGECATGSSCYSGQHVFDNQSVEFCYYSSGYRFGGDDSGWCESDSVKCYATITHIGCK